MESERDLPSGAGKIPLRTLKACTWEQLQELLPWLDVRAALIDLSGQYRAVTSSYRGLLPVGADLALSLVHLHEADVVTILEQFLQRLQVAGVGFRVRQEWPFAEYILPLNLVVEPVRDRGGELQGMLLLVDGEPVMNLDQRLAAEHSLLNDIIDLLPDPVFYKRADGVYERFNRAFCTTFGVEVEQVPGRRSRELLPPSLADVAERCDQQVLESGAAYQYEDWIDLGDGQRRFLSIFKQPRRDANGRIVGIIGVGRDLSADRRIRQQLSEASLLFEAVNDACLVLSAEGLISAANPGAQSLFGCDLNFLLGKPVDEQVRPTAEEVGPISAFRGSYWQGEVLAGMAGDTSQLYRATLHRVPESQSGTESFVLILTELNALGPHHHQLVHRAYHDPLTGLPNRELVRARLEHSIHQSARMNLFVTVLYLDLDGFKQVNDSRGHIVGDRVLKQVASGLASQLRQGDTLARVGGDEFLIVLEGVDDLAAVERVCSKLLDVLSSVSGEGDDYRISASIGIAISPDDGADVETLIHRADLAMYEAKRRGKGRVCHYSLLEV